MKRVNPEDAWNGFLARLDVTRLPWAVDLRMVEDFEGRRLKIRLLAPDIRDGSPLHVFHTIELPPFEALGDHERLMQVIGAVNRAFEHEVRECVWLDGRRQSNPHFDHKSLVIWHAPVTNGPCKCDYRGIRLMLSRQGIRTG